MPKNVHQPGSAAAASPCWMRWAVVLLLLGFLWFTLINQLRVEWSVNPQYSYGWVVPFLCVGLLIRRWSTKAEIGKAESRNTFQFSAFSVSAFCLLAFMYLPTRLIQEANPEWRLISWALALEVVGLTLLFARWALGSARACWVAFPICFFLVAVPWPTIVEGPLIQSLTRINSSIVVELLGWTGIPAIQHGNLIEVSTGTVGVNEACSGIRSFQTSLMISLFFGEFYRMNLVRRLMLVPAGFILAMAFNVCRMSFLTMVAAKKGVAAIDQYHDPAGVAITITCTLVLWGVSVLLLRKQKAESRKQKAEVRDQKSEVSGQISEVRDQKSEVSRPPISDLRPLTSGVFRLSLGLLIWLIAVEVGVESWYRWHEARLSESVSWTMDWPRSNPTFSQSAMGETTTRMLRYDEAVSAMWREDDGTQWQMIYLRWLPGRIAVYLANQHTPDACLPAAGRTVETLPDPAYLSVRGLSLPFHKYILNERGDLVYVFYGLWEDRALDQSFQRMKLGYGTRLEPVLEGKRNVGERSLEILVRGTGSPQEAEAAIVRQLEKLIKVEKTESGK